MLSLLKKYKAFTIGISGLTDEGDINRLVLVNALCWITTSAILGVGAMICGYFNWRPLLIASFVLEFVFNGSVLVFNYYKLRRVAAAVLYFVQCASILFYTLFLGKLLRLDIVLVLLFAIVYLIFKDKKLRRWGVIAALIDFAGIETLYYHNPFQFTVHLDEKPVFWIQLTVVAIISVITVFVSVPYVSSNDTNEKLKRANHLIKIFVAQITHELRAPLDTIHHVTQLLRGETKKDTGLRKIEPLVDIGWTVSSTARNIVNNVLDMAEIEAGKTPVLVNEAFKVRPFFEKILDVHRIMAQRAKMQLELAIDGSMPPVIFGDPLNINQVLSNLLGNALKYGSDEGPIRVEVRRLEAYWELKVINTGPGIPAARHGSIFDLYYTTRSGHVQGSGLGLYIVKAKVELMGGVIGVESRPFDKTTFTVVLPLHEGKLKDLPDGPGVDIHGDDLEKVHVLAAEDDKLTSFLISRFLEEMGCSVTMVRNGRELLDIAEKKCQDECPDIIMVDCHMPVLNGVETIRLLKENPALRHIPIIVTTGDVYSDSLDKMLTAGASTYIKKPIDHVALRKTITLYIKKLPQN